MTQPTNPFGQGLAILPDANGVLDFTPDFQVATGIQVLAQSLVMRQTTARGTVLTSPNACIDVRQYLGRAMSQSDVAAAAQAIRSELLRDTRVLGVSVSIVFNTATAAMTITETIQSSAGPFTLTLVLTAATIQTIVQGQS